MDWPVVIAVLYLILGAILWWLGIVILRENPRSRVNRVTALMLSFAGLGPIFAAIGSTMGLVQAVDPATRPSLPYNLFYVWEFFFPQLLLFSFVFPREHRWVGRFRRSSYLIFLPHVIHVAVLTLWARPDFSGLQIEAGSQIFQTLLAPINLMVRIASTGLTLVFEAHVKFFSVVNLLYIVAAVWALHRGYRSLTNPRLRNQVRIIIVGILSGVSLYTIAFIAPTLGLFDLPEPIRVGLAILALLVGVTAIAWSIIRYQFLDVRLFVRQSVVFTISSGLLVGMYLLLITRVSTFIKDMLDFQSPLVDVAFVVLVLIFFQPMKNRVDGWITRLFLRDEADPRAILEAFSREIISVFSVDDLKARMLKVITEQLFVERAFFAHREPGGRWFSLELAGLENQAIPIDDPFFTEATVRGRPAAFEEFVLDRPLSAMTEILTRWQCYLVVPIVDRGELTAALMLGDKISGYKYTVEDVNLLATLANQLAVAFTNVGLYEEALERQSLEDEMNVARRIQMRLLPRESPVGPTYQVAAFAQPSRQVGGDYYDFFFLSGGRLGIVIADVSGKGLGAALLVSQLQAFLKSELRTPRRVCEYVTNTNALVVESTATDQFATLVYAEFDPETRVLEYTNAGHNYPIVVRSDGSPAYLDQGGLVLGAFQSATYVTGRVTLDPDDVVLFYTDGLSDLEDHRGNDFGDARILQFLRDKRHLPAEALKNELVREATEFSRGELGFDDLTMVILKVLTPPETANGS
ncbi:MAG TPA: SpoIIE family protein phosphatase [Acidobacteriota bacterium]|nr:SpoIIE family protein phosphatase [Acidobacteriota bacterium]